MAVDRFLITFSLNSFFMADYITLFFQVVGGLALFLLGMKNMSEGMQGVAGSRLRRMIASVTNNRLVACATGAGVTSLIQSSSITSVMVISMVTAGLMTLRQAIGVILGADIGTTITAWIIALNVVKCGLPLLGLATFVFLFAKRDRVRFTAMLVMGLGMVFYGLDLMQGGLLPISKSQTVLDWFAAFHPNTIWGVVKCVCVGSLVTALVQSSSATVGITITLARAGVIDLDTAAALVLGQNIGTTMTAGLAALGASREGVRVACAHIVTKVFGVVLAIPLFFPYMRLLSFISNGMDGIASQIALAHTLFNVFLVLLFLPLVGVLARALSRLIPDAHRPETRHLCYFDHRLIATPVLALQQSFGEILRMREMCDRMLEILRSEWVANDRDEVREHRVFRAEDDLDTMQTEIVTFLSRVLTIEMPLNEMVTARLQLRIADEYESIGDYAASLQKMQIRARRQEVAISETGMQQILHLHDRVVAYLHAVGSALEAGDRDVLDKLRTDSDHITGLFKEYRKQSMDRLAAGQVSPVSCVYIMDALHAYRKIKDHGFNISEAVAGQK
jgi:phosphate:Na+ symporter